MSAVSNVDSAATQCQDCMSHLVERYGSHQHIKMARGSLKRQICTLWLAEFHSVPLTQVSRTFAKLAEVWDPTSCCLPPIQHCCTCCQTQSILPTAAPPAAFLTAFQHIEGLPVQHAPAIITNICSGDQSHLSAWAPMFIRVNCSAHQQEASRYSPCGFSSG